MIYKLMLLPLFVALAVLAGVWNDSTDAIAVEETTESVLQDDADSLDASIAPEETPPDVPGIPILLKIVATSDDGSTFAAVSVDATSDTVGEPSTYAWKDLRICRASGSTVSAGEAGKLARPGQPIYWVDAPEKLSPTFREALSDRTLIVSP